MLCPQTILAYFQQQQAFGKTVTAIGLIAKLGVNTLILVHTKALLDQWVQRLEQFLVIDDIPEVEEGKRKRKKPLSPIGTLSSTGNNLHGIIDIALMQSCIADNEVKNFVKDYGLVIADECHHVSAVNFEQILKAVNARYVYGLTATPIRKDGCTSRLSLCSVVQSDMPLTPRHRCRARHSNAC